MQTGSTKQSAFQNTNIYFLRMQRFLQYLHRVAFPPRICRSCKFMRSTPRTCAQSAGSNCCRRSVTSLCTVDLLTPNLAAQVRTVHPVSSMNLASATERSKIDSHMHIPPIGRYYILCPMLTDYVTLCPWLTEIE